MKNASTQQNSRKVYLDLLRMIAIYMVLFTHTASKGFSFFAVSQYSSFYPLYLFVSVLIKIAVPTFFMISGTLLLGKNEPLRVLLKKRVVKYLIVLIFASLSMYLYTCFRADTTKFSISGFFKALYSGKITTAYWYLYAYLAFLLMLPLLRKLAQSLSNREFEWMIILMVALGVVQIIQFIAFKGSLVYNKNFSFFITQNYIFYPLMGYYFDRKINSDHLSRRKIILLWILSFIVICISCYMTDYKCTLTGDWRESTVQTFFGTFIFIPTNTLFVTAKYIFTKCRVSESIKNIISKIGATTFGIFLIERICRAETQFVFDFLKPYIHTFPACLVWIFVACVFGCVIILLLKKIPIINKFI